MKVSQVMKTLRRNGLRSTSGRLLPKGRKKGQKALSPGHHPGCKEVSRFALKGQKNTYRIVAFALTGRRLRIVLTQGDALGYRLVGLSGRLYETLRN